MNQRNKRGFGRKALLAGMLALGGLALAGCEVQGPGGLIGAWLQMGEPEPITPEAQELQNFWVWTWLTAWVIGIIMWVLMLYHAFFSTAKRAQKKGKGEFPNQLQYNIPLEIILTFIPIAITMTLFFNTVRAEDAATALDKDPQVVVDVTAFQWNWKFGYQQIAQDLIPAEALAGQTVENGFYQGKDEARTEQAEYTSKNRDAEGNVLTKEVHGEEYEWGGPIHGNSISDHSYLHYNDIETLGSSDEIPVLVLPSNTAIEFQLASADVSHAFWVPQFMYKHDAYAHPEMNNSQRAFQVASIDQEGAFVGRCAEMCGTYHAMMNFELRVVSPEAFREYIGYRLANPNATNAQALESIGEAGYATSTHPFVTSRIDTRNGENVIDQNA
ncbi:MAG: cytochrome c oxidase subunit II [Corynebacterium sp.]|nr:cytochrome c oxidase subunit II [Corynebacterium sp.]